MGPFENAIEDFRKKQQEVCCADPKRIERDANIAKRTAQDHVGRWFFELFQNRDDAQATKVMVLVSREAIYVADNGQGLKPTAIESICGTDYSDKTVGTIGRKGVGFKAVYELTENPRVFTGDNDGIEFSVERARAWFVENRFRAAAAIPHQWIPFYLARP